MSKKFKIKCIFQKKKSNFAVSPEQIQKISEMLSQKKTPEKKCNSALGLDYKNKLTNLAGESWTPKMGLKSVLPDPQIAR